MREGTMLFNNSDDVADYVGGAFEGDFETLATRPRSSVGRGDLIVA